MILIRTRANVGSAQVTVAGPHWSEYMPVREGRVCTYSSTGEVTGTTTETVPTQKYTDVREEADGTQFTLESTMKTATDMERQYDEATANSPGSGHGASFSLRFALAARKGG